MKRLICALLAALLLMSGAALAEDFIDITTLSLAELYELRERVDARIEALENDAAPLFPSGLYLVGRDIPAGDYLLMEIDPTVISSVIVRQGEENESPLILHKLVNGQAVIRLYDGTWVTLIEATAQPLETMTPVETLDAPLGEGAYLVGSQLPAGDYIVCTIDHAPLSSYSVYDGILGTDAEVIRFEVVRDTVELALRNGDYIELSGCMIRPAE